MVKWGTKENHAIEKAVYEGSADDVRALIARRRVRAGADDQRPR